MSNDRSIMLNIRLSIPLISMYAFTVMQLKIVSNVFNMTSGFYGNPTPHIILKDGRLNVVSLGSTAMHRFQLLPLSFYIVLEIISSTITLK